MELSTLASLGEFVAGVGVIVTLAYLAVQMRHNTQSVRANTGQGLADAALSLTQSIYTSEEVTALFHKAAHTPDQLTDVERFRWHLMATATVRHFENGFVQQRLGTLEPDTWFGMERSYQQWCALPGFNAWLADNRGRLSTTFDRWLVKQRLLPPVAAGQAIAPDPAT